MISWKEQLEDYLPAQLGQEIDVFETQIELKKQSKVDDKLFAETRLRRGVTSNVSSLHTPAMGQAVTLRTELPQASRVVIPTAAKRRMRSGVSSI